MYVIFLVFFIFCMINVLELWLYEFIIKVYLYYIVLVKYFKDYIDINIYMNFLYILLIFKEVIFGILVISVF